MKARSQSLFILGLVLAIFIVPGYPVESALWLIAGWAAACLCTEMLWHPTRGNIAIISMAPAAFVPALVLLPGAWGIAVTAASSLVGVLLRRRGMRRSVGYIAGATLASASVLVTVRGLHLDLTPIQQESTNLQLREPLVLALAAVVYLVVYQVVVIAIAAEGKGGFLTTWREAFGYQIEAVTAAALVILVTLAVFCYESSGFRGLLLCVMPLLFIRDGSRRYLELKHAQERIVLTERLAAKGEMAAEIGHELNNYLAAISGRAQLLELSGEVEEDSEIGEEVGRIQHLTKKMSGLAKGLMDFSHRETMRARFPVNDLVQRTVDLVQPQARFQLVRFHVQPDPAMTEVEMDPGQIQQALLTLMRRAARPAKEGRVCDLHIRTVREERGVVIDIADRLPEAPGEAVESNRGPLDDELESVARVVARHRGQLLARDEEEVSFRLVLPAA